ncbi:hypothetical protein [Actinacidiphila glaucinigra]|uniref:hypothetical protein n=1 Tax=Actinacidiphila glaucinigra TaxID=235986 RepID=UPI00371971A3
MQKEQSVDRGSKWMVGVRFPSAAGRAVRHFYLVDGAVSSAEARSTAVSEAGRVSELAGRQSAELDPPWVEVQRVVRDPLGRVGLSAPLPVEGKASSEGLAVLLVQEVS